MSDNKKNPRDNDQHYYNDYDDQKDPYDHYHDNDEYNGYDEYDQYYNYDNEAEGFQKIISKNRKSEINEPDSVKLQKIRENPKRKSKPRGQKIFNQTHPLRSNRRTKG